MNKPDDVPQDVWDMAAGLMERAYPFGAKEFAARAILSERTRCAEICDAEIALCRQYGVEHIPMIENIKRQVTKGSL